MDKTFNIESVADSGECMSLSEYLGMVQSVIDDAYGFPSWIVCELAKVSWSGGHCYLELVESGANGATLAKTRGTIWSRRAAVLNSLFMQVTGDSLRAGIKVMLNVQVQFSPVYGFSLNVVDLNPSFTVGDMEAQRRATIKRLEREGLIERNKELEVAFLPYRVAVVSAEGAAGYGDFMKHLKDSGIRFEVELFSAAMQGEDAPSSISAAFDRINERSAEFDVAVLIRGGGSNLDLVCFDDYITAKAVALCHLPVISGVGHERDNHICDDVASVRVKTPTGAADFLIQRFADAFERIDSIRQRIVDSYSDILEGRTSQLNSFNLRLSSALGHFTENRNSSLKDLFHRMRDAVSLRGVNEDYRLNLFLRRMAGTVDIKCVKEDGAVSATARKLENAAFNRLIREESLLDRMRTLFEGADPSRILDKGYGIILKDGRKISDISQIEEGSALTVLMRDGKVSFTATGVSSEKKSDT